MDCVDRLLDIASLKIMDAYVIHSCASIGKAIGPRMAEHFALMTGRMITEATLQGASFDAPSAKDACDHHDPSIFEDGRTKTGVVVECRICQEEGDQAYMETPCSCKGSLKARFSAPLPA